MLKFTLLLVLLVGSFVKAQKIVPVEKQPTLPVSPTRLFYVQRSSNTNTIVYDANVLANKKIDVEDPINVYWIRYTDGAKQQPLNLIQRTMAYGVNAKPLSNEPGNFDVTLSAYKKRHLKVSLDPSGLPVALTTIAGKINQLQRVFVMIEETGHLIPKVLYVELFGRDPRTGSEVYEKFKP